MVHEEYSFNQLGQAPVPCDPLWDKAVGDEGR